MITRKSTFFTTALITFCLLFIQTALTAKSKSDLSKSDIIPKPVSIIATGEYFILKSGLDVYVAGESAELKRIGQFLADKLKGSTGYDILVKSTDKTPGSGNIYLTLTGSKPNPRLG